MPYVAEADREALAFFLMRDKRPACADPAYVSESVWAEFLRDRLTWAPISEAPRDGRDLEVLYDDGWNEHGVYWASERACMLGRRAGSKGPGWLSTEAGHLPTGDGPEITHYRIT